jgi:pSer/pThr/pTyr-binding forkhead associated (FHA) protein
MAETDKKESYLMGFEIINGVYDGMEFKFSNLPITIGRSPDNDISIPYDSAASRSHARIVRGEGRKSYVIIDLNSTNGTFLNYIAIKDQSDLKVGDVLKIGDTLIKCQIFD